MVDRILMEKGIDFMKELLQVSFWFLLLLVVLVD